MHRGLVCADLQRKSLDPVPLARCLGKRLPRWDDPQSCRRNAEGPAHGARCRNPQNRMCGGARSKHDRARSIPIRGSDAHLGAGRIDGPHAGVAVQGAGPVPNVAELQFVVHGPSGAGPLNGGPHLSAGGSAAGKWGRGGRSGCVRRSGQGCGGENGGGAGEGQPGTEPSTRIFQQPHCAPPSWRGWNPRAAAYPRMCPGDGQEQGLLTTARRARLLEERLVQVQRTAHRAELRIDRPPTTKGT